VAIRDAHTQKPSHRSPSALSDLRPHAASRARLNVPEFFIDYRIKLRRVGLIVPAWVAIAVWQPVGLRASRAKIGPSEASFCGIRRLIAQLWAKKTVKNAPLRPICSRRFPSPAGC
jgi:hypothetical protein